MSVLITAGVVAMTMAARKIPVQIPRKGRGPWPDPRGPEELCSAARQFGGRHADHLRAVVHRGAGHFGCVCGSRDRSQCWPNDVLQPHDAGRTTSRTALLIVFFTYFYTAIIFNPVDLAENLKKQGAFIPGVKPGARTAEYIDRVLTRVTLPGSVLPGDHRARAVLDPGIVLGNVQTFFFGGTSLLIVVGVGLDTVQQAQQLLLLRHYDGFMKKGRVKMRGRQKYM